MTSFWSHFKYLRIVTIFRRGSYCDCNTITNQAGIVLRHEQTFHSRFAYKQIHRKLMQLRRVTFHMTIYSRSPVSSIWKIKRDFVDNTTTFRSLTALDLGFIITSWTTWLSNSNLMLTRALLGPWIFHHLLGVGVWTPPVYLGSCAS